MQDAPDQVASANSTLSGGQEVSGGGRLPAAAGRSRLKRFLDSDLLYSFLRSKLVVAAAIVTTLLIGAAFLAPLIAPHNPYDLKSLSLLDSNLPPMWEAGGEPNYPLGTDDHGRDILSTIL